MAAANGGSNAARDTRRADRISAYLQSPRPLVLTCGVQHYGWGDHAFIPALLGQPAPADRPHAELWIGAHHELPATAELDGVPVPLDRLIAAAPAALLGAEAAARFGGELPFLFKVLSAATPLSIQAHPNRTQAEQGFADEDRRGIAPTDPRRNYRDRNHKPELLLALTEFHALRGFRPLAEIAAELAHYPALRAFADTLDDTPAGLRRAYGELMRLPQPDIDALLAPVIATSRRRADDPADPGQARCRWLLDADRRFSADGHHDRGLLAFLLLNLLHLHPGQAMFLPAGELHSYLAGAGLELMANSNNVLRGGLTTKHIDVDALLGVLHVDPRAPAVCAPSPVPDAPGLTAYAPPVSEFALHRLRLAACGAQALRPDAIVLGLVLQGDAVIADGAGELRLGRGSSFLLPAGREIRFRADGGADVALATVAATPGGERRCAARPWHP
jgi:mannose-6-phosphate isomerase